MTKPIANLATSTAVNTSKDCIIIVNNLEDIRGGATLDATGIADDTLSAGHIIIEETATGVLKPMPYTAAVYDALPASHTYKGVLVASILTAKPFASIMVRGTVNEVASPFPLLAAMRTVLTLIRFTQD